MPIEVISIGPPTLLLANVVYALPAVEATMYTDNAGPTTLSNTAAFVTSTPVTFTAGAAMISGGFIKATTNMLVTLRRN